MSFALSAPVSYPLLLTVIGWVICLFCGFGLMSKFSPIPVITLASQDYERSWHIEAIAYQLERVRRGEITRLIINTPPRRPRTPSKPTCRTKSSCHLRCIR